MSDQMQALCYGCWLILIELGRSDFRWWVLDVNAVLFGIMYFILALVAYGSFESTDSI
jgi:hypothetical protein